MNKINIILIFFLFAFVGCDSNDSNSTSQNDDTFAENFGSAVNRSFIGQVVDINNDPLQGVEIKIGSSTVQTDINGVFILNDAPVYEKFAYITAKKTGYIDGSRAMVPTSGKNNVKIMMIANAPVQTVQSGIASEATLPNGSKVNFDGAFQDESGNTYTGPVIVSMFHLKPSDENLNTLMPGMLYAQTENGSAAALETFGMMNVELKGSGGQKLNIAEGHTAEITVRIDDSQLATAPSTIPLWHFDEDAGYWKEDGEATKVGNNYVGEVSHFSWWNCDMPNSSILLTFNFVDANGTPLSNYYIDILNQSGAHASGSTDSEGQLSGILPANEVFIVNVYSPFDVCGDNNGIIFSTTVGPFSEDTVIGQIHVQNPNIIPVRVSGSLANCDNTAVTNGYVVLTYDGEVFISNLDGGNYNFSLLTCSGSNNFSLKGFDFDNLQTTGELNYIFTFPETHIDRLMACNDINEYITFSINGENTFISSNINSQIFLGIPTYGNNLFANQMTIYANYGTGPGGGAIQTPGIAIECGSTALGNYTLDNTSVRINTSGSPDAYFFIYGLTSISNYDFRINKFGNIGDYIDVTFSGTIVIQQVSYVVTGTAHVLRDH